MNYCSDWFDFLRDLDWQYWSCALIGWLGGVHSTTSDKIDQSNGVQQSQGYNSKIAAWEQPHTGIKSCMKRTKLIAHAANEWPDLIDSIDYRKQLQSVKSEITITPRFFGYLNLPPLPPKTFFPFLLSSSSTTNPTLTTIRLWRQSDSDDNPTSTTHAYSALRLYDILLWDSTWEEAMSARETQRCQLVVAIPVVF